MFKFGALSRWVNNLVAAVYHPPNLVEYDFSDSEEHDRTSLNSDTSSNSEAKYPSDDVVSYESNHQQKVVKDEISFKSIFVRFLYSYIPNFNQTPTHPPKSKPLLMLKDKEPEPHPMPHVSSQALPIRPHDVIIKAREDIPQSTPRVTIELPKSFKKLAITESYRREPIDSKKIQKPSFQKLEHFLVADLKYHPIPLTSLFKLNLDELNITLSQMTSPSVLQKGKLIQKYLKELYIAGENPNELAKYARLTHELLTTRDPTERALKVSSYQEIAKNFAEKPNPLWRVLGVAMMGLGIILTSLGLAFSAAIPSPLGLIGAGAAIGGIITFGFGLNFFLPKPKAIGPKPALGEAMMDLSKAI